MDEKTFEKICEDVHNAWWEEKKKQGVTDHPDMIPYYDLSEEIKDYDRVTVRTVLNSLNDCIVDINMHKRIVNMLKFNAMFLSNNGQWKKVIYLDTDEVNYLLGLMSLVLDKNDDLLKNN